MSFKKIVKIDQKILQLSIFLILIFLIYTYLIARVPNFIYTRYIVLLVPILIFSILLDAILLAQNLEKNKLELNPKFFLILALVIGFIIALIVGNSKNIKGHIAELLNQYKGPLDFTIPAILEKYKKTDTLTIAANYEETSYMYYLGAKVTVGFIGNNLEEDSKTIPDVMAYRKPWGNYTDIFQNFMRTNVYSRQSYNIYDNPVNNIPELNFMPAFNHKFETIISDSEQEKTELYFKK